jgi:anti-sigma B factor antagonist
MNPLQLSAEAAPVGPPAGARDGSLTVAAVGELDVATAPILEAALARTIARGSGSVYLDLSECTFVDSSALRVMAGASCELASLGRSFALLGASGHVRRVIEITGLDGLFPLGPAAGPADVTVRGAESP